MKIKGITFWEQHLEKLVILTAAVLFVGLTAWQFIGNPNGGEVDRRSLTPGEVDAYFRSKARDLMDRIEHDSPDAEAIPEYQAQAQKLREQLDGTISRAPLLASQISYRTPLPGGAGDVMGHKRFIVPQPQAPVMVAREQYVDALLPEIVEKHEALKAMFPNPSEPYDLAWATVRGTFDAGDLLRQFRGEQLPPGAAEAMPVPEPWYSGKVFMVDVVMERVEIVDGNEMNPLVIQPLPGQLTFRPRIAGNIVAADRDSILRELDNPTRQDEVIRPEFYPTKSEVWTPPQVRAGLGDPKADGAPVEKAEGERLQEQISEIENDLERLKAKLEELGGPVQETDPDKDPDEPGAPGPGSGGGGRGGSGPPGGGLGAGSGSGRGKNTGQDPDKDKKGSVTARKGLMKKIAQKEQQLAKLNSDLEALAGADNPRAAANQPDAVVTEQGVVDIWAHDITVEPGKTYRYRLTMHVYNPFFGRKLSLIEEQREHADRFTLASAASDWCDPITVTDRLRLFITKGEPPEGGRGIGQSLLGRVSAEVYRFYDGRWRREDFTISPGDRIGESREQAEGGARLAIDYSTDWFVLDVIKDIDATETDEDRGRDGLVLLQSLTTGAIETRDPRLDAAAADRSWLQKQVELTEVAVASP